MKGMGLFKGVCSSIDFIDFSLVFDFDRGSGIEMKDAGERDDDGRS